MNAESLGFQMHHNWVETYCGGCGNPESSGEHGTDCPRYDDPTASLPAT
ncbi:hypothetical protein EDD33_2670 [Nocardioides aurantiacus]|uniref:Uncharacterized protein n=1 Tax=Nocardioides aurantiacus TaxID=86796 RepID=A0A3N2CW51_9ACTN|nr:hypothetical protein EDD33_2670 [Nocardioides aurantiacus]